MNPNNLLISVVLPVYNVAPYLEEAVRSILRQDMDSFEVVMVNDGSTDNSEEVIQRLLPTDSRLRAYRLEQNSGLSVARNVGFSHARGQYVYFMDSDDVLLEGAFRAAIDRCLRDRLEVLVCQADIFCEEGAPRPSYNYHHLSLYEETRTYRGFALLQHMLEHRTFRSVSWIHLIRRDLLLKLGLEFYPGIIHEDQLYTCLLMMQSERMGCMKRSLIAHRMRAQSITGVRYSWRNVSCYITVIDELFRYATDQEASTKHLVNIYTRYTLNPVLQTAKVIPLRDKWRTFRTLLQRHYLHYVTLHTWAVFLLKRK